MVRLCLTYFGLCTKRGQFLGQHAYKVEWQRKRGKPLTTGLDIVAATMGANTRIVRMAHRIIPLHTGSLSPGLLTASDNVNISV